MSTQTLSAPVRTYDCKVQRAYCLSLPPAQQAACDYEQMTSELEDWARLPSSRDAARSGAAGTQVDDAVLTSGDYLTYLITHNLADLGNSTLRGYYCVTSAEQGFDGDAAITGQQHQP
jgi:hypothetical protein